MNSRSHNPATQHLLDKRADQVTNLPVHLGNGAANIYPSEAGASNAMDMPSSIENRPPSILVTGRAKSYQWPDEDKWLNLDVEPSNQQYFPPWTLGDITVEYAVIRELFEQ
jgi:hypothetical protein